MILTCDDDILPRKTEDLSIEDIAKNVEKSTSEIDIDEIVAEADEWARKSK